MRKMLLIESGKDGILYVNGQFCGPMEAEGQAFPCGSNEEIYIQLFPTGEHSPLTARMQLRGGEIIRLDPKENCYALLWPEGIIQLELRMREQGMREVQPQRETDILLRYLTMRLAGDEQARLLLLQQDMRAAPELSPYYAAVPLRFAPPEADAKFDLKAGLVRRISENVACVDAVLGTSVPAGQGRRLIERIEIMRT